MTQSPSIPACIYLIRHATPDWSRKDIPYNLPPGPPLVQQGELEAARLGEFLQRAGVRKLYHSPLERARATAAISAAIARIPIQEDPGIPEIRPNETDEQYALHLLPVWDRTVAESRRLGPIGLVSHGGPVRIMLQLLGMTPEEIEAWNQRFDGANPIPPAGAWRVDECSGEPRWRMSLAYIPEIWEAKSKANW